MNPLEHIAINLFNKVTTPRAQQDDTGSLLGTTISENGESHKGFRLPLSERVKHTSLVGKSGSGKSSQILNLVEQDVRAGRGFLLIDLHGDLIPRALSWIASCRIPAQRVVLIDPANLEWAVGLNPIEAQSRATQFRETAEVVRALLDRWQTTGAQTEEVLRNTLLALSENSLTLLEVVPFLSVDSLRAELLKNVTNAEVREFFELRFDPLSPAMQARLREPVANKLTELTADPFFRHVIGQRTSTICFERLMDTSSMVLVDLNKGNLGRYAGTLGAFVFAKVRAAAFRRKKRELFTIYVDEVQNLVAADTPLEELLSECRKYGLGLVTANQFLSQLPSTVRSAVEAVGTHLYFQVSPEDAEHIARSLSGGKELAKRLANLPARHFLVRYGNNKAREVRTPDVVRSTTPADALIQASYAQHACRRDDVERDILSRRPKPTQLTEVLDDWE